MKKDFDLEKRLDQALSDTPDFELPVGFADKVVRQIEMKKLANDRRINLVVMLASFGFLLLAAICFLLFANSDVLSQLLDFGGWAIVIGVMVVFIQVLDNRLVKKKVSGSS